MITIPITGRVRILPGWGVGHRSMSLQAVGRRDINNQQLLFTNEAQLAPTGQSGRQSSVQTSHYTVVLIYGRVAAFVFLNLETLLNSVQVK